MYWKFDCNACKKYVEQGAAPEQLYVEYMDGNVLMSAQYAACSACAREIKKHNEKRENQRAQAERMEPAKVLPERPEGMPEKFIRPQAEVDAFAQGAKRQAENYEKLLEDQRQAFERKAPAIVIEKGFPEKADNFAFVKKNEAPPDALAMILAQMVDTQQQMLRNQEHTNELLGKLAQPKPQQQQSNKKNNWRGPRSR